MNKKYISQVANGIIFRMLVPLFSAFVFALFFAGECATPEKPILVNRVTLDKTSIDMLPGKTASLAVTVEPETAKDKSLTWSSDNEDVVYVQQTSTGITIRANSPGTATITATSNDEGKVTAKVIVDVLYVLPDTNFKRMLKEKDQTWFATVDNKEGLKISKISLYDKDLILNSDLISINKIKDVTGIEYFTKLTVFSCQYNSIKNLDLSRNTALKTIRCDFNNLGGLDVSKNMALVNFSCKSNQLDSLDLSKNVFLKEVNCVSNSLRKLDLRGVRGNSDQEKIIVQITALGESTNNRGLTSLLIHDDIKMNSEIKIVKERSGDALTISTWSASEGSAIYTETCSNWDPEGEGKCISTP